MFINLLSFHSSLKSVTRCCQREWEIQQGAMGFARVAEQVPLRELTVRKWLNMAT